ncbi:MAG: FG-GAP repeat protein, partial [Phycisphaerales bacterium]|nr:FG-GAP repeat protein [Phycisphaerales bacterium]
MASVTTGAVTGNQANSDPYKSVVHDRHGESPCDSFQLESLLPGDGSAGDEFGISVALSDKTALIGAYKDRNGSSANTGSAYIFEQGSDGNWTETTKLVASDFASDDRFGLCVDLTGDIALIGVYQNDDNGLTSGSAYVFQRQIDGQWLESIKLLPSDGIEGDGFGASVSISSSIAIVGAPFADEAGASSGSAYVFIRSDDGNWIESARLTAS